MFPRGGDFTHIGDEPDQMSLSIGVDLAADGTVYVVDSGNNRVQKFAGESAIGQFPSWTALDPVDHFGSASPGVPALVHLIVKSGSGPERIRR